MLILKKKKWKLILVGDGSLKIKEKNLGCDIKIVKRLTPKKLSKLYNESLFFILPSLREHWGLVVHEASLSGCFLLLSNNIGSTYEFSNKKNSFIFNPLNINSIQKAIEDSMILNNKKLITGNKESERLGNYHNYNNFYEHIKIIINNYLIKNSLSYAVVK
jgi:glycosyltransferase involved in cell wall biosynthesis